MRVFFLTLVCSGALLGQAALAQTDNTATSAQPMAPAATATVAPAEAATAAAATAPAAVPQQAQTGTEHVVVQGDANSVNLDEVVCKNSPATTGSRLGGGRECHTVREWNDRQRQAQDATRQQQVTGFVSKPK